MKMDNVKERKPCNLLLTIETMDRLREHLRKSNARISQSAFVELAIIARLDNEERRQR
jgi:DNA-binding LytR/AlgR family response regulator